MKWSEMMPFLIWSGVFQMALLITAIERGAIDIFLLGLIPLCIGVWFGTAAYRR